MEKIKNKCNILLAVGGLNPQIITEGLFCLVVKNKVKIDKLVVIATKESKERIENNLKTEILRMSQQYNFKIPDFADDNILYVENEYDVKTAQETFTDLVFNTLNSLVSSETNVIHCLISGGRKTMSVDLAMAMSLLARNCDKMYHVLAEKEFESKGLYFPENQDDRNKVILIEKPFLHLRHRLSDALVKDKISYNELISKLQNELDDAIELKPVIINVEQRTLAIGEKVIKFQPFPFAVYLFFAKQTKFIVGGKNFSRSYSEKLWKIYRRVSTSRGQLDRVRKYAYHDGLFDFDVIQKAISNIRRYLKIAFNNSPMAEYYAISVEGNYSNKRYGIKLPKEKIILMKKSEK